MPFVNLTPHAITLITGAARIDLPTSETEARVHQTPGLLLHHVQDVPIYMPNLYGQVDGLPEDVGADEVLIVSTICAPAIQAEAAELVGRAKMSIHTEDARLARTRLAVLSACVTLGTGPNDDPERNAQRQITGVRRLISVL